MSNETAPSHYYSPDPAACLSRLGREIRNSMHLILGLAEILLESNLAPTQMEYVNVLRNNADRLLSTTGDIVALGTDEGKPSLHLEFDLIELLNQTTELLQSLASFSKGVLVVDLQIDPKLERQVSGSRQTLEELLVAVVCAATRTGLSGRVTLAAGPDNVLGSTRFTISLPLLESVMGEPAPGTEPLDVRFAVACQLASRLGGDLQIETTLSASVVSFTAQLVPLTLGDVASRFDGAPDAFSEPLKVLLAEDTADSQFLMTAYLKGQNCIVDIAGDGVVAIQKVQARAYDIVFMDLDMPEMDGVEATRIIRQYEHSLNRPAMPIVALTARTEGEIAKRCVGSGFSAYMAKPVTRKAILGALSSYVSRGRHVETNHGG